MNKAKFITLDNGLTILIYTDNSKSTNHVELYTFFGGNNGEYVDYNGNTRSIKPGTAHLLEHYICENTVEGNLLDNLRKYNILSCNGGTNNENTSYFFNTVTNFYECLETFLRGIYNISFTKEKLDKTKMAVYSEIRDDKNNEKNKIIEKKINGLFTINRKTLGSSGSVKSITIKEIKDVYDNIYIPCNQFLVLSGNFDYDKTLSLVKNIYKEISFKNDKKLSKVSDVKDVIKKRTIYKSDYIDEVIAIIRAAYDDAAERLMKRFKLTEIQANAILEMKLRTLSGLQREKIEEEYKQLMEQIERYRAILASEKLVCDIIRDELLEMKAKYGDERRTQIISAEGEMTNEDLIKEESVVVAMTRFGYIKRMPVDTYKAQRRGGKV